MKPTEIKQMTRLDKYSNQRAITEHKKMKYFKYSRHPKKFYWKKKL